MINCSSPSSLTRSSNTFKMRVSPFSSVPSISSGNSFFVDLILVNDEGDRIAFGLLVGMLHRQ